MEEDATAVCGAQHRRHGDPRGYRWGTCVSEIGLHGGRVKVPRTRVRDRGGKEVGLPRPTELLATVVGPTLRPFGPTTVQRCPRRKSPELLTQSNLSNWSNFQID